MNRTIDVARCKPSADARTGSDCRLVVANASIFRGTASWPRPREENVAHVLLDLLLRVFAARYNYKHVAVFGNVQPNDNARRGNKIEVCYDGRLIAKHSPRTVHGKIEARQGFGKRVTAERETAAAVEEMIAVVAMTDEVVFKRVATITRKVPQRTVIIAIVRTSDVPCCMQDADIHIDGEE